MKSGYLLYLLHLVILNSDADGGMSLDIPVAWASGFSECVRNLIAKGQLCSEMMVM